MPVACRLAVVVVSCGVRPPTNSVCSFASHIGLLPLLGTQHALSCRSRHTSFVKAGEQYANPTRCSKNLSKDTGKWLNVQNLDSYALSWPSNGSSWLCLLSTPTGSQRWYPQICASKYIHCPMQPRKTTASKHRSVLPLHSTSLSVHSQYDRNNTKQRRPPHTRRAGSACICRYRSCARCRASAAFIRQPGTIVRNSIASTRTRAITS